MNRLILICLTAMLGSCTTTNPEPQASAIDGDLSLSKKDAPNEKVYRACLMNESQDKQLEDSSFQKCGKLLPEPNCSGETCGGLRVVEVMGVIRVHLKEISRCYEDELKHKKDARGKLVVAFSINGDGKAENIDLEMNQLSDSMGKCTISKIDAWRFPKPRQSKKVQVRYPFVLNPL